MGVAAVGRHLDELGLAAQQRHRGELDHGVMRERTARLALASGAMAAVDEHRRTLEPEADLAAGATALGGRVIAWYDFHLSTPFSSDARVRVLSRLVESCGRRADDAS